MVGKKKRGGERLGREWDGEFGGELLSIEKGGWGYVMDSNEDRFPE